MKRKKRKGECGRAAGITKRMKSKWEQKVRTAAGDNKRKKSKGEQDRAVEIKKRQMSKGNKKTEQQHGI